LLAAGGDVYEDTDTRWLTDSSVSSAVQHWWRVVLSAYSTLTVYCVSGTTVQYWLPVLKFQEAQEMLSSVLCEVQSVILQLDTKWWDFLLHCEGSKVFMWQPSIVRRDTVQSGRRLPVFWWCKQ
jgi:hypothetical protein